MIASIGACRAVKRACAALAVVALVAVTVGASASVVQAAPPSVNFGAKTDYPIGDQPRSVAMGDVNGDTFLDLATANFDGGSVSVLLGDGAGGFGAHTDLITGGEPISVAINDLNGDTRLDLAVANYFLQTVSALIGDGTGGFAAPSSYAVNGTPHSVAVRDLNGDLVPDLAVANGGTATVSVLLGDGAGGFGGRIDYATGDEPRSVVVADVNGDTFLDLATANSTSDSVSVLLGDGTGGFGTATGFTTGVGPESVAVGDLNGDLRLDVGAANRQSNSVSVLLNTTGTLTAPPAPTIVNATPGHQSATVSWIAPINDGGSAIIGYVVTPYVGFVTQGPRYFVSTATTQTISGLTNGTTYRFRVRAWNSIGVSGFSRATNQVTPTTTAPGQPTIGTAVAGDSEATVSWTTPTSDGGSPITGYEVTPYVVYFPHRSATFNSTATTQTVTGLTNGTTYRFRVRAINAIGFSGYSKVTNPVTPTT